MLMNMSLTDVFNLVQTSRGVAAKLKPGAIIFLPGNYMIIEVSLGGGEVRGLCWSLVGLAKLASMRLPNLGQFLGGDASQRKSPYTDLEQHLQQIKDSEDQEVLPGREVIELWS
eukprot:8253705-Pyramimonas_sp.AAC.1